MRDTTNSNTGKFIISRFEFPFPQNNPAPVTSNRIFWLLHHLFLPFQSRLRNLKFATFKDSIDKSQKQRQYSQKTYNSKLLSIFFYLYPTCNGQTLITWQGSMVPSWSTKLSREGYLSFQGTKRMVSVLTIATKLISDGPLPSRYPHQLTGILRNLPANTWLIQPDQSKATNSKTSYRCARRAQRTWQCNWNNWKYSWYPWILSGNRASIP